MGELSRFAQVSRIVFIILTWLFLLCVALQTGLAGLAVFQADPSYWSDHKTFVHIFEIIPVLMLIFAFLGNFPHAFKWLSVALFLLISAQYATARIDGAGAVHPVIALVMFWLTLQIALWAGKATREKRIPGRR